MSFHLAPRNGSYVAMPPPMVRTNSFYANQARADSFYPKQPPFVPPGLQPGASFYGNQAPMRGPSPPPPTGAPKAPSMILAGPMEPLQVPVIPDRQFMFTARSSREEPEQEEVIFDSEEEEPVDTGKSSKFKRFTSTKINVGKIEISGKKISRKRRDQACGPCI